jgi:glycosyltransferase domain-containing protein
MQRNVTIIVPSYNRPDLLAGVVSYLTDQCSFAEIAVVDGSDAEAAALNRAHCEALAGSPDTVLRYWHSAGSSPGERIRVAVDDVSTPLVGIVADDDLIDPVGYKRSVDFLMRHSDFSAAHGTYVGFSTADGSDALASVVPAYENSRSFVDEDAFDRCVAIFRDYVPLVYAVLRTEVMAEAAKIIHDLVPQDDYVTLELVMALVPAARGKVRRTQGLYYARRVESSVFRKKLDMPTQVFSGQFATTFDRLRGALAQSLFPEFDAERAGDALEVVFSAMLSRQFEPQRILSRYGRVRGKGSSATVRRALRSDQERKPYLDPNLKARLVELTAALRNIQAGRRKVAPGVGGSPAAGDDASEPGDPARTPAGSWTVVFPPALNPAEILVPTHPMSGPAARRIWCRPVSGSRRAEPEGVEICLRSDADRALLWPLARSLAVSKLQFATRHWSRAFRSPDFRNAVLNHVVENHLLPEIDALDALVRLTREGTYDASARFVLMSKWLAPEDLAVFHTDLVAEWSVIEIQTVGIAPAAELLLDPGCPWKDNGLTLNERVAFASDSGRFGLKKLARRFARKSATADVIVVASGATARDADRASVLSAALSPEFRINSDRRVSRLFAGSDAATATSEARTGQDAGAAASERDNLAAPELSRNDLIAWLNSREDLSGFATRPLRLEVSNGDVDLALPASEPIIIQQNALACLEDYLKRLAALCNGTRHAAAVVGGGIEFPIPDGLSISPESEPVRATLADVASPPPVNQVSSGDILFLPPGTAPPPRLSDATRIVGLGADPVLEARASAMTDSVGDTGMNCLFWDPQCTKSVREAVSRAAGRLGCAVRTLEDQSEAAGSNHSLYITCDFQNALNAIVIGIPAISVAKGHGDNEFRSTYLRSLGGKLVYSEAELETEILCFFDSGSDEGSQTRRKVAEVSGMHGLRLASAEMAKAMLGQ